MISLSLVLLGGLCFIPVIDVLRLPGFAGGREERGRKENLLLFHWPIYNVPYVCCIDSCFQASCDGQAEWRGCLIQSQGTYSFINYHWKLYRWLFSVQVPSPEPRPWADVLRGLLQCLKVSVLAALVCLPAWKAEICRHLALDELLDAQYKASRSLFIFKAEVIFTSKLHTFFL